MMSATICHDSNDHLEMAHCAISTVNIVLLGKNHMLLPKGQVMPRLHESRNATDTPPVVTCVTIKRWDSQIPTFTDLLGLVSCSLSRSEAAQYLCRRGSSSCDMAFEVADCRDMKDFEDCSFGAVLDKGTMDAMLCADDDTGNASKTLTEVYRVLRNGTSMKHPQLLYCRAVQWRLNHWVRARCRWDISVVHKRCAKHKVAILSVLRATRGGGVCTGRRHEGTVDGISGQ